MYEADVADYIEESGVPFPAYADTEDSIARDYEILSVPFLAFITKDGLLMLTREFTYAKDVSRILDALIAGTEIDTSDMETVAG